MKNIEDAEFDRAEILLDRLREEGYSSYTEYERAQQFKRASMDYERYLDMGGLIYE